MPAGLPEPDEQPKEPDPLVIAFLQGAKWWEWQQTGATMWPSDQQQTLAKAQHMLANGSLGKSHVTTITTTET